MQTESDTGNRMETVVAVLIALVTVIGAVVAWRASVAGDGAGDADFAGLRASLNAEETRALNAVNAYEHYAAYTTYWRNNRLGDALAADIDAGNTASEEEAYLLDRQRAEAYDLADANQDLFPNRYLNRDGTYGLARETGEAWADAAREKDLYPDPRYAEADQLRAKANQLLGTITILGLALVVFTLVETVAGKLKLGFIALGTLLAVGGAVAAVLLELAR